MNATMIKVETGEVLARVSTPFMTRYQYRAPEGEMTVGESMTDTSLYQPLKEVVERCERAGMLRQLLDGANSLRYDSDKELADDVLDNVEFQTGDLLSDVNHGVDAILTTLDERSASSGTPAPAVSSDAIDGQENAVSDDENGREEEN